jgi:1-acyl-sn-glycerol-3-phosphate acyltransferase
MTNFFDVLTVACFLVMAVAFFFWTKRDVRTLLNLSISGVAFAVANHLGNSGWPLFALLLIAAGAGYSWVIIAKHSEPRDR